MNEVKVEAPMLSPTLTKSVFGLAARYCLHDAGELHGARRPSAAVRSDSMRPWKSLTSMMSIVVSPSAATAADGTDSATRTPGGGEGRAGAEASSGRRRR